MAVGWMKSAQKMKILAMADESTFNCQRKYLRWTTQVLSFLGHIYQPQLAKK